MIRHRVPSCYLLVCLTFGVGGCGDPSQPPAATPTDGTGEKVHTPLPKAPEFFRGQIAGPAYLGTVSDIGSDWFEIAAGWSGGNNLLGEILDNSKPRRLSVAGTIPGGEWATDDERFLTHVLADLQVGDVVGVIVGRLKTDEEWAIQVTIRRRPGGKIPPIPPDHLGHTISIVARNQAEQDWEEKGIPIPEEYLRKDGRTPWTNPPYPPVAPMPRPAAKP